MLVDIRSRTGRISSGLRSYVHRVRDLSFGRFRDRVRQVVVKVTDGGNALRECVVDVQLKDRGQVVARGRAPDLYAAIRSAFAHAARALARRDQARRLPRVLPAATH